MLSMSLSRLRVWISTGLVARREESGWLGGLLNRVKGSPIVEEAVEDDSTQNINTELR